MAEGSPVPALNAHDDPLSAAVRARTFLLLLQGGRPVPLAEVGAPDGWTGADVRRAVDELVAAGRMTVADDGAVLGSLGLSVVPTRHVLALPAGERYTWCALDAVGVFGALAASGQIRSTTPDGEPVLVDLDAGRPRNAGELAVLLPDPRPGPTVRNWCPLVNFFRSVARAGEWSAENGVPGRPVGIDDATTLGSRLWRDAIGQADRLGTWTT